MPVRPLHHGGVVEHELGAAEAAEAEGVPAGDGRLQCPRPAHAEAVRGNARERRLLPPGEVERRIHAHRGRRSAEVVRGVVRAGEAMGRGARTRGRHRGAGGLRGQRGRWHHAQHGSRRGPVAALRVDHFGRAPARPSAREIRHLAPDARERGDRRPRDAVVVAEEHVLVVGTGADHRDGAQVAAQRQCAALVPEQHDRLPRRFARERAVRGGIVLGERRRRIWHARRRVEHPEAEPGAQQSRQRGVHVALADEAAPHRVGEARVGAAAVEVGPGAQAQRGGFRGVGCEPVAGADIVHGIAVGDDVPGEAPAVAQDLLEEPAVAAGRRAAEAVVCAHHRPRAALDDGGLERREVGIPQVVLGGDGIEAVAAALRAAVHGEVLGGRDDAEVVRVVALHPAHEGHGEAAGEERVLAIRLHPAAPARVAQDVDVG